MNLVVANLKARVVNTLENNSPIVFSQLARNLRVRDEKRLDNTLQELRRTGQIRFLGPSIGWEVGRGKPYAPAQRNARRSRRGN